MPAAVDVDLEALGRGAILQQHGLVDGLVLVLEEEYCVRGHAVLVGQEALEDGEGGVGIELDVRDLADTLALVEQVDGLHVSALRGSKCEALVPVSVPLPG